MIINNMISEKRILEFEFTLEEENDKVMLIEILSTLLIMKFQIYLDEDKITKLELKKYIFKYDYKFKEKTFIETK